MNLRTAIIALRILAALGILSALVSIGATIWHLAAGGPVRDRDAQALVLDVFLIAFIAWMTREIGPTNRDKGPTS
ncbi:hypothetical protein [Microbispora sp. GKU 823]|uniref:hypothetical protein n=1 Tax=Microbispora sp. GKU 823 TaxID=1652100 RepID=UPI0009A3B837|nr:hypothetical protein [Microbispora sp. GKU 823]OPG13659.1 hypothetical protein B1L11_06640 [Microbispora sp. GKU 823]